MSANINIGLCLLIFFSTVIILFILVCIEPIRELRAEISPQVKKEVGHIIFVTGSIFFPLANLIAFAIGGTKENFVWANFIVLMIIVQCLKKWAKKRIREVMSREKPKLAPENPKPTTP